MQRDQSPHEENSESPDETLSPEEEALLYISLLKNNGNWYPGLLSYSLRELEAYARFMVLRDETEKERKKKQNDFHKEVNQKFYSLLNDLKRGKRVKKKTPISSDSPNSPNSVNAPNFDLVSVCTQYNEIDESTRKMFSEKNYVMQIGTSYHLSRQDLAEGFNQLHEFFAEKYKDYMMPEARIIYCKSIKGDKVEMSFNITQLRYIAIQKARKKNASSFTSALPEDVASIRNILGKDFKEFFTNQEKIIIRKTTQLLKEEMFICARKVDLKSADKSKEFSLEPTDIPIYEDVGIIRLIMPKRCTATEWQFVLGGLTVGRKAHHIIEKTDLIDEGFMINFKEHYSMYMLIAFNYDYPPTKRFLESWWNYKAKMEVLTRVSSRTVL